MDALGLQVLQQRVVALVERDDVEVRIGLRQRQSPEVVRDVKVQCVSADTVDLDALGS